MVVYKRNEAVVIKQLVCWMTTRWCRTNSIRPRRGEVNDCFWSTGITSRANRERRVSTPERPFVVGDNISDRKRAIRALLPFAKRSTVSDRAEWVPHEIDRARKGCATI